MTWLWYCDCVPVSASFLLRCCRYGAKYQMINQSIICLFVSGFSSHSRFFHSDGDVTIAGEGLQILTYARHSWPLSSEGSLAYQTYCDTVHSLVMVIFETVEPSQPHLLRPRSVAAGIRTPNLLHARLTAPLTHFQSIVNKIVHQCSLIQSTWLYFAYQQTER